MSKTLNSRPVARVLTFVLILVGLAAPALAKDSVSVTLQSSWNDVSKGAKVPVYVWAMHTADFEQRVTVTGCGMHTPRNAPPCTGSVSAVSQSGTPYGTQFMNVETRVEYTKDFKYTYEVKVEHRAAGTTTWKTSAYGKPQVIAIGDHGVLAVVPNNDDPSGDKDFNDALVLISMWHDSND